MEQIMTDPDNFFFFFAPGSFSLLVHTRCSAHASPGGLAPFLWPGEAIRSRLKKKKSRFTLGPEGSMRETQRRID